MMREIFQESSTSYKERHLGQDIQVLWEKATPNDGYQWVLSGLTDNYLRVSANSPSPCRNQIMNVHITGMNPYLIPILEPSRYVIIYSSTLY
jgi:tRNA A37 methylthiotransferase MiaB